MSEELYNYEESDLFDYPIFYRGREVMDWDEVADGLNRLEAENKAFREKACDKCSIDEAMGNHTVTKELFSSMSDELLELRAENKALKKSVEELREAILVHKNSDLESDVSQWEADNKLWELIKE